MSKDRARREPKKPKTKRLAETDGLVVESRGLTRQEEKYLAHLTRARAERGPASDPPKKGT